VMLAGTNAFAIHRLGLVNIAAPGDGRAPPLRMLLDFENTP